MNGCPAAALSAGATEGGAQGFPTKPITLVSPFPPGGSTDTAARIIAERMRAPLGQSVVGENVGGAGGTIGVGRGAPAAPPGHTPDNGPWGQPARAGTLPTHLRPREEIRPARAQAGQS